MFGLLSKKQAEKEFSKVSQSFRDIKKDFKDLNKDLTSNKEKIARLEGVVSMIIKEKPVSQSHKVPNNLNKSQDKIEIKIVNRVRRNKKAIVKAEIVKLRDSHSVIEMFEIIVLEKGLCSKASFYRYVAGLKFLSHSPSLSQVPETNS